MNGKPYLLTAIGLALLHWGAPAMANATPGHGLQEVSDEELGTMRGRYTVGNNDVAWFGVSMISTWQSSTGQVLQGTLTLGMDFSGAQPKISFVPTVTITAANAPMPAPSVPAGGPSRSVIASGLANIGGMLQSVQVAGDGNLASNLTSLNISTGNAPASSPSTGNASLSTSSGGATVTAGYDNGVAQVLLNVAGEGNVRQWVQNGGLGQTVQLAADDQIVSNRMQIDLIRQTVAANTQLMQSVTQSLGLIRGIGNR